MTIILDENLPRGLCNLLAPRSVVTAQETGYGGMENGQLLAALEGLFNILITADRGLRVPQGFTRRRLAIVELPTNRWPQLRALQSRICAAVDRCQASSYLVVTATDTVSRASRAEGQPPLSDEPEGGIA